MKNTSFLVTALALTASFLFSGCEHNIRISSDVHPDGSLDRTIVFTEADSAKAEANIFGLSEQNGWDLQLSPASVAAESGGHSKVDITFKKRFTSAEEASKAMEGQGDTLFRISSSFQRENRWFYTYIHYKDTYRMLNNFTFLDQRKYFTPEDFTFIERLPADGRLLSKADSLYLVRLNEKIFDIYGARTIFEEFYSKMIITVRDQQVEKRWQDSLTRKKEVIFQQFLQDGNLEFIAGLEQMGIKFPRDVYEVLADDLKEIDRRAQFVSDAYSGKYIHAITMPWNVVSSNADSVVNNRLFWQPPAIKFLLSDYTMTATSRKMNTWAVVISGVVVCLTVGLFFYKRNNV